VDSQERQVAQRGQSCRNRSGHRAAQLTAMLSDCTCVHSQLGEVGKVANVVWNVAERIATRDANTNHFAGFRASDHRRQACGLPALQRTPLLQLSKALLVHVNVVLTLHNPQL
jgi:hypothetical protein